MHDMVQGSTSITADLAQNDRAVHVDFFNGIYVVQIIYFFFSFV